MDYSVETLYHAEESVLAFKDRASLKNLSGIIGEALSSLYKSLQASNVQGGRNVVIYYDQGNEGLLMRDEIEIAAAVLVDNSDTTAPNLSKVELPEGFIARTTHTGPYEHLYYAHAAVRDWCEKEGLSLTGLNWEVYGHWDADPKKLQTEVFYLLKK